VGRSELASEEEALDRDLSLEFDEC
jgi:hypothetical protein